MPAVLQSAPLGSWSWSEDGGIVPLAAARRTGGTEANQRSGTNSSMSGKDQGTPAAVRALYTVST